MKKKIYNTKLKKFLVSLLLIVLIIENMMPCLSFAFTTGTITLNEYILEMVKSWADEDGKILNFIYAEEYEYVYVNEIDIEYFWVNALYDMPSQQNNDSNQGEIFEVKARKLIDSIITILKKDYEKSDGYNNDLNDCLYQLISDRQEASNGFLGFGKKEAFNNGDDIKVTVSNGAISFIDLSAIAIESYEIAKKSNENEENEENKELEEISEGVYKVDKDRYCCTYNVAEPIWNENGYLEDLVKNYLSEFSARNYDFKEVIAKYGNKIDYIAIYFNKIDEKGKPTGNKPGKLDIYIYINGLEIREEISSDERIQISEGIEKFKGSGQLFCTYNVAIKAWDEQYIKEQVQSKLKAICLDLEFDFDGIIELYGDDNDKIRIYFKEIDSQNNPIGENPESEDIKVYITREELLDNELTDFAEETTASDLGGILLSPIFYLINFVADAVISVTGNIMYPSAQGLDFGLGILTNTKPDDKYQNTVEKDIDTSSFLPTNFSGIFSSDGSSKYQYPHINYTPEEIFAGKVELLSIDFITGKGYNGEEITNSGWTNIRKVISQWYQVLRMIAIIGLLSVLIYTGIKIIISANAKDKAKYKEWIMNWLMAVAILFFMHYIMAFIVSVIGEFSKLMTEASAGITVKPSDDLSNTFQTNLMGLVRFMIQSESFYIKVAYEVMYIALIWYTLKFTITYLKRVLNMAFLTLIAPIVALTYPIDKLNDGKAQGFDMWLKEYIFNALLQPMHCILYYILVGSAVDIATTNPLYGIAVLAFMSQAENLLKKIFGFDKAGGGTVGGMANAFAAGAIASKISKMAKLSKGNAGKGGDGSVNDDLFKSLKATDKNSDKDDALFDGSVDKDKNTLDAGNKENEKDDKNTPTPISSNGQNVGQNVGQNRAQSNTPQTRNSSNNVSTTPVRSLSGRVRGAKAVGKRLAKPIWDFDHSGKYNRKRLRRKIGRAAFGAALGVGAAAVQAGISITDGKYNPMEGMASFAAGYAGAGKITKGIRSLGETYKEGTLPDNIDERKKEIMKRAQKEWADREDVIKHNKNKYSSDDRKNVLDIQKQLLEQGVTDLKEMDDCIKYIKSSNNGSLDSVSPDMVRKSRVMHDFSGDANVQKVMYDPSKRKDYIDSVAKDDREKKILENKFNEAIKYNNIVNKK